MNFWDYMTYHLIRDWQKDSQKQKEKKQKYNAKRMQNAGTEFSDFGSALLDIAEVIYTDGAVPNNLSRGAVEAFLYQAAKISRFDGGMTQQQGEIVRMILKNIGGVSITLSRFQQLCCNSEDLNGAFQLGFIQEDSYGTFWEIFFRMCYKTNYPQKSFDTVTGHLNSALAEYAFAGRVSKTEGLLLSMAMTVNSSFAAAKNKPAPDLDVMGDGKPREHYDKFCRIVHDLAAKSNAKNEIADYRTMLAYLWAKSISDMVMLGNIPARDKIDETDMYFMQFHVDIDMGAKEFLLSMGKSCEVRDLVAMLFDTPTENGLPMFWRIVQIMAIKANDEDALLDLCKAYLGFLVCMASELHKKYPNGEYSINKAREYAIKVPEQFEKASRS